MSETTLEEWQAHVVKDHNDKSPHTSYCGAKLWSHDYQRAIQSARHAENCVRKNTRLQPCPECWRVVFKLVPVERWGEGEDTCRVYVDRKFVGFSFERKMVGRDALGYRFEFSLIDLERMELEALRDMMDRNLNTSSKHLEHFSGSMLNAFAFEWLAQLTYQIRKEGLEKTFKSRDWPL